MLGVLIVLLVCAGLTFVGRIVLRRLFNDVDPAEALGLAGLVSLGSSGLLVFLLGLIPGFLPQAPIAVLILAIAGLAALIHSKLPGFSRPNGWPLAVVVATALALLFALVGALGPSDMNDWDSLAYHLAVPKIWLEHGQIDYIPYIHHSNFPGAIDNLFILGLKWGGAAGAKTFSVIIFFLGILTIFGLARRRYGARAGWLAALAFVGVPCALWEAGTAYIDVGHGLFAGLGILYAAEVFEGKKEAAQRMAICLALACASKYTGLQTFFACAALLFFAAPKAALKPVGLAALAALVLAGPWYLRNVVNTGNPVYPFFYEVFDGKNWDDFSAQIYKEEQQTFGAGRLASSLGASVLGLAYQPGRFTNPAPTQGGGMPTGALGFVVIGAWLVWLISGRMGRFEKGVLVLTGLSLAMWFDLSQQSRYLITLAVPAAVLAGAAVERLKIGPVMAGAIALQAAFSLYISKVFHFDPKVPVVVGKVSAEDYQKATVPFFEAAQGINQIVPKDGKVALYDEVFGYFLDVPYFWANPGHSTQIPYASVSNGEGLADELKKLGFTHVYLNTSVGIAFPSPEARERWLQAAGIVEPAMPFTVEERQGAFGDLRNKWRVLLAEAIAAKRLEPVASYRSGLLLDLQ